MFTFAPLVWSTIFSGTVFGIDVLHSLIFLGLFFFFSVLLHLWFAKLYGYETFYVISPPCTRQGTSEITSVKKCWGFWQGSCIFT